MNNSEAYQIRQRARQYLEKHAVMTLATNGPQGLWAAAVFYTNQDFELFFLSAGHSRHGQNIAVNPNVAVTIQEQYVDWLDIKGIQLEGRVQLLGGEIRSQAISLFRQKYRFLDSAPESIKEALDRVQWYRLYPQRLYFIDNSQGFGHRDEIGLGQG